MKKHFWEFGWSDSWDISIRNMLMACHSSQGHWTCWWHVTAVRVTGHVDGMSQQSGSLDMLEHLLIQRNLSLTPGQECVEYCRHPTTLHSVSEPTLSCISPCLSSWPNTEGNRIHLIPVSCLRGQMSERCNTDDRWRHQTNGLPLGKLSNLQAAGFYAPKWFKQSGLDGCNVYLKDFSLLRCDTALLC
jgi:hypothetical protein